MPFAYYNRLSPARQRIYRKSDAIEALALPAGVDLSVCVVLIREGLAGDDVKTVRRASQQLVDALVTGYGVLAVRIRVLARRPVDGRGELHGLYEPEEGATCARITVWMRTAQRQLCHHLDYELFKLPETFHTDGFYKRESSLAGALLAQIQTLDCQSPGISRDHSVQPSSGSHR